jgi:pimeloyl-ACP methyl ester carboxylesterase
MGRIEKLAQCVTRRLLAHGKAKGQDIMKLEVRGLQINYEKSGVGPPLVLVHGGGLDLVSWEDMVPHLESSFSVFRFDMRGFGKTERQNRTPMSMEAWALDLAAFIEALKIRRPSIVGWSLGGAVACEFTSRFPDVAETIALIGAPGPFMTAPDRSGFDRREAMIREGHTADEVIDATFDFTKAAFSPYSVAHNPRSVERIRAGLKRNFTTNYAEMVDALRSRDMSPEKLRRIKCPALVIVGEDDSRTPVSMSEELNKYISRSYLKVLENCGHYYGYEQPRECTRIMTEFLHAFGSSSSQI